MRRLIAILGVTVFLIGGCASEDSPTPAEPPLTKAEYQRAITKIITSSGPATSLFFEVVFDNSSLPVPDDGALGQGPCAAKTKKLAGEIDRMVDDAAALTPPRNVAALHDEFVAQARLSADAVSKAADRAATGELACGRDMNIAIYGLDSTDKAERALMQIEDKGGYQIFFE